MNGRPVPPPPGGAAWATDWIAYDESGQLVAMHIWALTFADQRVATTGATAHRTDGLATCV
jgi:hypothetical protein